MIDELLMTSIDPHGHGMGSLAAHGSEGACEEKASASDEESSLSGSFDESAMAQVVGVFILEFGVLLHRLASSFQGINSADGNHIVYLLG